MEPRRTPSPIGGDSLLGLRSTTGAGIPPCGTETRWWCSADTPGAAASGISRSVTARSTSR
jgi:hypothetical protein